jgi:hypothetical protein
MDQAHKYFNSSFWRYDPQLGIMIVTCGGVVPMSDEQIKAPLMSYDPASIPKPINGPESYAFAQLVEMRAIRKALGDLVNELRRLNTSTAQQKTAAKK